MMLCFATLRSRFKLNDCKNKEDPDGISHAATQATCDGRTSNGQRRDRLEGISNTCACRCMKGDDVTRTLRPEFQTRVRVVA